MYIDTTVIFENGHSESLLNVPYLSWSRHKSMSLDVSGAPLQHLISFPDFWFLLRNIYSIFKCLITANKCKIYVINGMCLGLWCSTQLSKIFQVYHDGHFYWWRKPEYPEKTTDMSHVSDKFITWCCIALVRFELTTLVVIGTDCKGSLRKLPYVHDHDGTI